MLFPFVGGFFILFLGMMLTSAPLIYLGAGIIALSPLAEE